MLPFHDGPVICENIIVKILLASCSVKISYRKNFCVYGNLVNPVNPGGYPKIQKSDSLRDPFYNLIVFLKLSSVQVSWVLLVSIGGTILCICVC